MTGYHFVASMKIGAARIRAGVWFPDESAFKQFTNYGASVHHPKGHR